MRGPAPTIGIVRPPLDVEKSRMVSNCETAKSVERLISISSSSSGCSTITPPVSSSDPSGLAAIFFSVVTRTPEPVSLWFFSMSCVTAIGRSPLFRAVNCTQGRGGVLAAKAVDTQGKGRVLAAKAVEHTRQRPCFSRESSGTHKTKAVFFTCLRTRKVWPSSFLNMPCSATEHVSAYSCSGDYQQGLQL